MENDDGVSDCFRKLNCIVFWRKGRAHLEQVFLKDTSFLQRSIKNLNAVMEKISLQVLQRSEKEPQ